MQTPSCVEPPDPASPDAGQHLMARPPQEQEGEATSALQVSTRAIAGRIDTRRLLLFVLCLALGLGVGIACTLSTWSQRWSQGQPHRGHRGRLAGSCRPGTMPCQGWSPSGPRPCGPREAVQPGCRAIPASLEKDHVLATYRSSGAEPDARGPGPVEAARGALSQRACCLSHSVYEDKDRENHLVFVEEWESEEALQRHFAVPESGAFVNALGAMAAVRPRIRLYRATELPFPGKSAA